MGKNPQNEKMAREWPGNRRNCDDRDCTGCAAGNLEHTGSDNLEALIVAPRVQFEHFCVCGKRGSFGFKVKLLEGKEGQWSCREHRPR
jgi:hypothetical protein